MTLCITSCFVNCIARVELLILNKPNSMNTLSKETIEKIEADILKQLEVAEAEVTRLNSDLKSIRIEKAKFYQLQVPLFNSNEIVKSNNFGTGTFNETIENILSDGIPRTSRQLLDEFNRVKQKATSMSAFSAQLSTFVNKKDVVKIHTAKKSSIANKFWYGLALWFDGNELKKEFQERVKISAIDAWGNEFKM